MTIGSLTEIFQLGDLCYGFNHLKNPELFELKDKFGVLSVGHRMTLAYALKEQTDPSQENDTKIFKTYLQNISKDLFEFYQNQSVEFSNFKTKLALRDFSSILPQKTCKAYLLWAYFYQHKVHFILDNINMRYATEKDDPYERDIKKMLQLDCYYLEKNYLQKNITTNAELRFIYRNWSFLKDTVLFWKTSLQTQNLKQILPPWNWPVDEKESFYDLQREKEFQSRSKSPSQNISIALLWKQYGKSYKSRNTKKKLQENIRTYLKTFSTLSAYDLERANFCLYHKFKNTIFTAEDLKQSCIALFEPE